MTARIASIAGNLYDLEQIQLFAEMKRAEEVGRRASSVGGGGQVEGGSDGEHADL